MRNSFGQAENYYPSDLLPTGAGLVYDDIRELTGSIREKYGKAGYPEDETSRAISFGRTGLKNKLLRHFGELKKCTVILPDGRLAALQMFQMTMGSMVRSGQYSFLLYLSDRDNPDVSWMYKFNFENESGALDLDPSVPPRRIESGVFTAGKKSRVEAFTDIEDVIAAIPYA